MSRRAATSSVWPRRCWSRRLRRAAADDGGSGADAGTRHQRPADRPTGAESTDATDVVDLGGTGRTSRRRADDRHAAARHRARQRDRHRRDQRRQRRHQRDQRRVAACSANPCDWSTPSEGDDRRRGPRRHRPAACSSNVDAIIGPASSLIALEVLDELMADGSWCARPRLRRSRSTTIPIVDLFFRTVPSDSLTAQAMAAAALNTGVDSYAVVYLDDQFGRPFAQQTIEPARRTGGRRDSTSGRSRPTPRPRSSPSSPPTSPSWRRGRSC